jgi:Flp pilus assembly protein TadD
MRTAMLALVLVACGGPDKPVAGGTAPTTTVSSATPSASADMSHVTPPPSSSSANTAKGINALQAGDAQGAKAYFEAALKTNPKDAEALHYLGVADEKLGDKPGAEKAYKDALKVRPDLAEAAGNLAALYIDAQKWDDAIALLKPAVQKQPERTELHENLALALAGKGDQPGATAEFESALKQAPNDGMLLYTYGHQLGVWQQTEPALAKLRLARGAASDGDLLVAIGHEFYLLKAVGDCVPTFDKALTVKDAASPRTERGLCKLAGKDLAGAQADFQAAVTKEPNYALAHYWLGFALLNAKKTADGIKELETYLKLDPNGPKAKQAQDALTKAKGKK